MLNSVKTTLRRLGLGIKKSYPFVYLLPRANLIKVEKMKLLLPSLTQVTSWQRNVAKDSPTGELYRAWEAEPGGHKFLHYFEVYERVVAPLRERSDIRVLELGVYNGASLRMWRNYLPNASLVCGIDINPDCITHSDAESNVFVEIGSQADRAFLEKIIDKYGPFDLIIDDGSHLTSHMIESFGILFSNGMSNQSIYVIEDVHANYWGSCRTTSVSIVQWAAELASIMHFHYGVTEGNSPYLEGGPNFSSEFKVPVLTQCLDSIEIADSLIIFRRNIEKEPPLSRHI